MRKKLTVSVEFDLCSKLKKLSEMTRIPVSRLFDEAVEDLLMKHDYIAMLEIQKKKEEAASKTLLL